MLLRDSPIRCAATRVTEKVTIHLDKLTAVTIFVRVVDENGFSSAARSLELSTSYVSRQISGLESRLGVRLLNRSTRRQSLTPVGALFYRNCASILAQLEEAELAVTQMQSVPRGLLRVSSPEDFGVRHIAQAISDFMGMYEDLEIELVLEDRRVNPSEEGYDIVIRLGETASGNLLSREICPLRRLLVASPEYLRDRTTPGDPGELCEHACLINHAGGAGTTWHLHGLGTIESVDLSPALSSNNDSALHTAALQGRGIAYLPDYLVGDDLREGRLVHVLEDFVEDTVGVHAVYPEQKHLSARVRLFIDLLVARLGPQPPWTTQAGA